MVAALGDFEIGAESFAAEQARRIETGQQMGKRVAALITNVGGTVPTLSTGSLPLARLQRALQARRLASPEKRRFSNSNSNCANAYARLCSLRNCPTGLITGRAGWLRGRRSPRSRGDDLACC